MADATSLEQPDVLPLTAADAEWSIEPLKGGLRSRVREVWSYRRLLRFFANKALQKVYARTRLGWAWLFIRPLFPLLVKTLVFGGLLAVKSDGLPYFVFLVAGMTPWELFQGAAMWGTRSLELNRGLMRQIYVPRLILPLAMMAPAFVTFFIHLVVLVAAIAWYSYADQTAYFVPGVRLVWAGFAVVMAIVLALGLSLWTSVPALVARDVRFTLGYVMGFWVFLTPVLYPLASVPERWRMAMALNPMAIVVESFKYGVFGIGEVQLQYVAVAVVVTIVLVASGLMFFTRAEANAADRV